MSTEESLALDKYILEEKAAGKIRSSTSPGRAPVMFVKRKDGTLQLVVGYKKCNAVTVKDCIALPRQGDLIEKLKDMRIFTKLDLR